MKLFRYIIITYLFCLAPAVHTREMCSEGIVKGAIDKLADDYMGLKCDPIDPIDYKSKGFKTACECMSKGEKFTRIKNALFSKNRKQRADKIKLLLEQKVADALRSQIDNGFDQSLRLDALLKQGTIDLDDKNIIKNFPKNCRAEKVGELIDKIISDPDSYSCKKATLNKRLKLFLNGKKDFKDYLNDKVDNTFANAAMNKLSDKDKSNGMCIPYKTFQSLNNQSPLRATYLKMAKILSRPSSPKGEKSAFESFQGWATNRSRPGDVFDYAGKDSEREKLSKAIAVKKNFGEKVDYFQMINSKGPMASMIATMEKKINENNNLEEISREDILHLIKTDPIFERMVKDPEFFAKVTSINPEEFNENDPLIVGEMMKSQDSQCAKLYGGDVEVAVAVVAETPPDSDLRGQGSRRGIASTPAPAPTPLQDKSTDNLLTKYLCEDDFPKKFIDNDTIRNVLAPELKEEAEIKGLKHTEAIVAKWAYCSGDNVEESLDGTVTINLGLVDIAKPESLQPLRKFLNLSLNPRSDLESSADRKSNNDNEFEKFNHSVCDFVPLKCKELDAAVMDWDCTTSRVAESTAQNMFDRLGKKNKGEYQAQFQDRGLSDKEFKNNLMSSRNFSDNQVTSILLLRNQTTAAKLSRGKDDFEKFLRLGKVIPEGKSFEDFIKENGGMNEVLSKSSAPLEMKRRIRDAELGYLRDNVYSEILDDSKASLFANYFSLGIKTDETSIGSFVKSKSNASEISSQRKIANSGDISLDAPLSTDEALDQSPIYKRRVFKNFQDPVSVKDDPKVSSFLTNPEIVTTATATPAITTLPQKNLGTVKKESASATRSLEKLEEATPETTEAIRGGKGAVGSDAFFSLSGGSGASGRTKIDKTPKGEEDNLTTRQLENRLEHLSKLAEKEAIKRDGSDPEQNNLGLNPEIQKLRDQLEKEKGRIARNSSRNNSRNSGGSSGGNGAGTGSGLGGLGSNNYAGNSNSGAGGDTSSNHANAYDPLDRASTGRRNLVDTKAAQAVAEAEAADQKESTSAASASSKGGASKKGLVSSGGSAGSSASEGGRSGLSSARKPGRFPAEDNGESDPDDICGYEQELVCYFEFASIDVLSPSLSRFVEYLQLQGRSFKALEVFKYKNKKKPTQYFIHEYEPSENLTQEEKNYLYARVKKLSLDYRKNRAELKKIASRVIEVKRREINKDEVKELSKNILRLPDLNKLSARRARNQ